MPCVTDTASLPAGAGENLTHNVQPLLHEIRHALAKLLEDGDGTVIDLRSLPLAPGEEQKLLDELDQGEVTAQIQALGPTEIIETRYPGVWVVVHFNNDNEVVGKFIEVCHIPALLCSQQEDIREGLERLSHHLLEATT
ncbi:MAG: hydrogenase expression/formation protein [Gammaproteobacteria bacterium]|jgi:hydrogenase-1 operon protein HyaF|nr:hydrogenase expression/formation protein [Gammaproteobacteria bacterium]